MENKPKPDKLEIELARALAMEDDEFQSEPETDEEDSTNLDEIEMWAKRARTDAAKKLMSALRTDDHDKFLAALQELKDIDSE